MESSRTRDQTHVPCIGMWFLIHGATRKVPVLCSFPWFPCYTPTVHLASSWDTLPRCHILGMSIWTTPFSLGNIFPAFSLVKLELGPWIGAATPGPLPLTLGGGEEMRNSGTKEGLFCVPLSLSSFRYYPLLKLPSRSLNTLKKNSFLFSVVRSRKQYGGLLSTCNSLRTPNQPPRLFFVTMYCLRTLLLCELSKSRLGG